MIKELLLRDPEENEWLQNTNNSMVMTKFMLIFFIPIILN